MGSSGEERPIFRPCPISHEMNWRSGLLQRLSSDTQWGRCHRADSSYSGLRDREVNAERVRKSGRTCLLGWIFMFWGVERIVNLYHRLKNSRRSSRLSRGSKPTTDSEFGSLNLFLCGQRLLLNPQRREQTQARYDNTEPERRLEGGLVRTPHNIPSRRL